MDNDCVILPQFGGFVTNMAPARWVEEENMFLPPYRTIGFNPQLKINDGLLVQSYMLTHDATYPEATRLAEAAIDRLTQELYREGRVEMHGIGTLRRTIVGEYQFDATEDGVVTPALYGLGTVEMKPLAVLEQERKRAMIEVVTEPVKEEVEEKTPVFENKNKAVVIKIKHQWIANAVGVAAAIIMFFLLSTPVDNTYIEEENYASLGNISVFEQVKKESVLTTLMEKMHAPEVAPAEVKAEPALAEAKVVEPAPVVESVPVVEVAPAPVVAPVPVVVKKVATYNIIVASVPAESDVKSTIEDFAQKGYPGAFLVKGNGRFRIALKAFDTETEAYSHVNELKQNPMFKDAWVLKTRK